MASSQTEETVKIRMDTVRPLIESFFSRMKATQWSLLTVGAPDEATKVMVAKLLLDIVTSITGALLIALTGRNQALSEEHVQSFLGNTLPQCFAEVLDVKDQVQCASSGELTGLTVKEIAESFNSALFTGMASVDHMQSRRITPPSRLNAMVGHACKMLKRFTAKMNYSCTLQRRGQRTTTNIQVKDIEDKELEDTVTASGDGFVIETGKAIQKIIRKELDEIMKPLLNDVSTDEYELLQTESFPETKIVADDTARIVEEDMSLNETDAAAGSNPKGTGNKIQTFFAKWFARASVHSILAHLKTKFSLESEVENRQSYQSLMACIDSLVLAEDGFKNISSGNVTQDLSDLLYCYIADRRMSEMISEPVRKRTTCRKASVPESHATMYADIWEKVQCFLALLSWWLNTQASSHSERVALALMNTRSAGTTQQLQAKETAPLHHAQTTPVHDATAQTEKDRMSLRILMEKFVLRTVNKSKVTSTTGNPQTIIQRLLESTWADVKGADFVITPETYKNLDKDVFKDLRKTCGSAEMLVHSMILGEPLFDKYIASTFKRHLTSPKQRGTMSRFLSFVGKLTSRRQ